MCKGTRQLLVAGIQIDRCNTCLDGWEDLQGWERMARARAGYGDLPSKPYGWVKEAGFTDLFVSRWTLMGARHCRCWPVTHEMSKVRGQPRQGLGNRGLLRGAEECSRG